MTNTRQQNPALKTSAYQSLERRFSRMARLADAQAILHWDEAVMMPAGSSASRNDTLAELASIAQDFLKSPELADELSAIENTTLDPWQAANVREMRRRYKRATLIPSDLHRQRILASMECEQTWRQLRNENNWKDFAPFLDKVFQLTREELAIIAADEHMSIYDAALDRFSPGLRTETVDRIFAELQGFLPELTGQISVDQKKHRVIHGHFPIEKQKLLAQKLMAQMGFSFSHGRLDESHHPFCGGTSKDIRITTRYNSHEFISSLMGVLHETGHALYEMHLPLEWNGQPVGKSCGMAIHESQSLFMEMQICRSNEFIEFISPLIQEAFASYADDSSTLEFENLRRVIQNVEPGLIRVDADEVTYPSHIILRYQLERALFDGSIGIREIPHLWNEHMQRLLGLSTTDNDKDGCMQDVHWPGGAFGYFPAYTFGALIAAQLFFELEKGHPSVRREIANGEFGTARRWLLENVWSQGSRFGTLELVERISGPLSVKPFRHHLQSRYLAT